MSGRILQFERRRHGEAQRLLPWLVNGRLTNDEQAWVEQHVVGCSECRREYLAQHTLQAACLQSRDAGIDVSLDGARDAADAGWHRLRARLPTSVAARAPVRQRQRVQWTPWLGWATAAQALMILVLGVALWRQSSTTANFRTLGATPAVASGNLLIVFDARLDEAHLRGLLRASEARIVDGPNEAGAYVLVVPAARLASVRDALRAAPGVTLVASLDPERRP